VVVVWLVLGIGLLAVELHHLAFYAMFAAVGAFAAAVVAAFTGDAVVAQLLVAVATTAVGIVAVRPYVSRSVLHRRGGRVAHGVHGGLVDSEALAIDRIGGTGRPGHVRLSGESWLAVSGDGRTIEPGATVLVTAVQGTTLTVWPLDSFDLPNLPID
jgi:membrane protein implicated in regulation of membrane protease activity